MKYSILKKLLYKCMICWKKFPSKFTLDLHKKKKHRFGKVRQKKKQKSVHTCPKCLKPFPSKLTREIHIKRKHASKKRVKLEVDLGEVKAELITCKEFREENAAKEDYTKFVCSYCSKSFSKNISLRVHMQIHFGINKETNEVKYMIKQILSKCTISHANQIYQCGLCGGNFKTRMTLRAHIILLHINKDLWKLKCQYCGKSFMSKSNLKEHLLIHTGEKPIICHLCGWRGRRKESLIRHMKSAHASVESYKYSCQFCNKKFNMLSLRNHHISVHRNEKEFILSMGAWKHTCETCGKRCRSATTLITHIRTHSIEQPYMCSYCPYKCKTTMSLKAHVITKHTSSDTWRFSCEQCDQKFPTSITYNIHMIKHSGNQCSICGEKFKSINQMKYHKILVHETETYIEVKCEQCDKKFISKKQLSKHQKVHTKSFKCPSCNFACSRNTQLQAHVSRRHTNPDSWEHACEHCNRKFATKGHKNKHLRRHILKVVKTEVLIKNDTG